MEQSEFRINRHMLIMVLCCLIPVAILAAIFVFRIPVSQTLTYALILLCPLGHVLMMGFMGGHKHEQPAAQLTEGDKRAGESKGGAACH